MADKELLARLDRLHEENHHREIAEEIAKLPEEVAAEYEVRCRLGRALNNLGAFEDALKVLESLRQQGEEDSSWWSRMGYALYHLDRHKEAAEYFRQAQRKNPGNSDAQTFLAWMNVGPGGRANAWDGGSSKKKAAQPRETGNGWVRETAPRRRPKAANTANDWEGRGWEGTAALDTALFGSLRFPVKEGLFQTLPVTLEGREQMINLYIPEELARPENWDAITALLDGVPGMCRKARQRMERDSRTGEVMRLFVRDQLEELDQAPLLEAFGAARREEISPERFLQKLEPRAVTVAPLAEGKMACTIDFSLDPSLSDELLVFRFGQDQEICDITHES